MLFLEKLYQKKIYIISVIIICILSGLIYSLKFISKEYISSATILLIKTNGESENDGSLELSDNLVSTFEEIVKSDLTISEVKNNLNLEIENSDLKKCISLERKSLSDTFEIEVRNLDSKMAIDINKEIVNIFSDKVKDMYGNVEVYIVDSAHILKTTYGNKIILLTGSSFLIGIFISIVYILVLIKIEKKVKSVLDIESEIYLKKLIEIPLKISKKSDKKLKSELIAYDSEKSDISKAFKKLRTNIQFLSVNDKNKKVMLITSASKSEGKSYISANIAVSFAEVGKKVILIDADMNNGRQGKIFNIPNNLGLSNYLSSLDTNGVEINEFLNKFINETAIKNLNLITSGSVPPNSSELLTSQKLSELIKDLGVFYDIIIIDGTSVLTTTDSLILTRIATSTILVTDYKKTKKEDLWKAKKDVQNVGGKIIGVILNKVKLKKTKKTLEERKEDFKNIKIKISKKISLVAKYIKEKINEPKQKLLTEANVNIDETKNMNEKTEEKSNRILFIKSRKYNAKEKRILENTTETNKETAEVNENTEFENVKEKENEKQKEKKSKTSNVLTKTKKVILSGFSKVKNGCIQGCKLIKTKSLNIVEKLKINIPKYTVKTKNILKDKFISFKEIVSKKYKEMTKKATGDITNEKANDTKIENEIIDNEKNINNVQIKEKNKDDITTNIKQKNGNNDDINKINLNDSTPNNNNVAIKKQNETKQNLHNLDTNDNKEVTMTSNEKEYSQEEFDDYSYSENTVLVIVDAENAYCRVFSKQCFTEKLIRGIDKTDGFLKAHYSPTLINARLEGLMNIYNLTRKQAKRIDSLIYITLCDYDDYVWLERKKTSNKAEAYVLCMAKEYDKLPNESEKDYIVRCQRLRKKALAKVELDIEYKLDNLWKTKKMKLFDKISMNRFAKLYEINSKFKSDFEILKSKENKKFYDDVVKATENKLDFKEKNNKEKYDEIEKYEVEKNEKNIVINEEKIKEEKIKEEIEKIRLEKIAEQEKIKAEKEQERLEKKQEQEKIRTEKKEQNELKRKEKREHRKRKKEEKLKVREELRKQKEMEREKQKEEAKIEEELLGDNLYPKTKNNKSL